MILRHIALFFCLLPVIFGAGAAAGQSLIRDSEIEAMIRQWSAPIFAAAGLEAGAVRVHIVNNSALNAFVAGGQRVFIHTGLLLASDSPNQIIGVLAHEAGHIAGGHAARTQDALRTATAQSILAYILGAAAIVAGQGRVGTGIIAGGQTVAQGSLLKYSRTQEGAADQAAIRYLEETRTSARGLLQFMEKLGEQELLLTSSQDIYARTHPLARDRIDTLSTHVANSRYSNAVDPPEALANHARMKAKLIGFIENRATTLKYYPKSDNSLAARYARAIADYRARDVDKAIATLDELLQAHPKDPYFWELRGQILFESGRIAAAVPDYRRAVQLRPQDPLLLIGLGQALVASDNPIEAEEAIGHLTTALNFDRHNATAWRWLASAYGTGGDIGQASLATAERYMLIGQYKNAAIQADRATSLLPTGAPGHLRAQDIARLAKDRVEKQRKSRR